MFPFGWSRHSCQPVAIMKLANDYGGNPYTGAKAIFAFFLVISLWMGFELRAFWKEHAAAAELQALGGKLTLGYTSLLPLAHVRKVGFEGRKFGDSHLKELSRLSPLLPHLTSLALLDTAVTAEGLARLRDLKTLRVLNLSGSDIRDEHLPLVVEWNELHELSLASTLITDAGLELLAEERELACLILPGLQEPRWEEPGWRFALRCAILEDLPGPISVTRRGVKALQSQMPWCQISQLK